MRRRAGALTLVASTTLWIVSAYTGAMATPPWGDVKVEPSQSKVTGSGPRSTRRRSGPTLVWRERTRLGNPGS